MKKANFFLRVDLISNFMFALLWVFFPKELLKYNFELKTYDDLHMHLSRVLGLACLSSGMLSHYALKKDCATTKAKILSIKMIGYILLLLTMMLDNMSSKIMGDKHVVFGMFGIILLIINCYLGIKSLKKYIRKKQIKNN